MILFRNFACLMKLTFSQCLAQTWCKYLPWCWPPNEIKFNIGGFGHLWATARLYLK